MEKQRKTRGQTHRQLPKNELAEHENLVNQFNKDEEKKNLENLLFGIGNLPDSK